MACMQAYLLENMFFRRRSRVLDLFNHPLGCAARGRNVGHVNFERIAGAWSIFFRMLLNFQEARRPANHRFGIDEQSPGQL